MGMISSMYTTSLQSLSSIGSELTENYFNFDLQDIAGSMKSLKSLILPMQRTQYKFLVLRDISAEFCSCHRIINMHMPVEHVTVLIQRTIYLFYFIYLLSLLD